MKDNSLKIEKTIGDDEELAVLHLLKCVMKKKELLNNLNGSSSFFKKLFFFFFP